MSQKLFKVVEINRNNVYGLNNIKDTVKYYRIVLSRDILKESATYPIKFPKSVDTLEAIAELLTYKGDKRICVFPITNYNAARSQIYIGKDKNYSLQVEALFIINQLVFKDPFNYSSYPILIDINTNKTYCIDGSIVSKAFVAYSNWYKKLKKEGINYLRMKDIMPLDGTIVGWY